MTVNELIGLLRGCDGEAEVRIMSQEGWPFENAIAGLAVREDFAGEECDCDHRITEPHEAGCSAGAGEDGEYEDGAGGKRRVHRRGRAGAIREQRRVGRRPPLEPVPQIW
ncbi:MAG TPA: hypothetical protein VN697_10045 [Tepidiformaceae bacterium]|nr:hypothetical protein [Tepidiformaceae bacterium]